MSEIDFDKVTFEEVDLDDMESIALDDLPDFNPDLVELNNDKEIPVSVSLKSKSSREVSEEIEAVLVGLLESNDRRTILILTGERPDLKQDVDAKIYRDFISQYGQAVLFNAGLKWYGKLVNHLKEESFKAEEGSLQLSLSARDFEKVMRPFLSEFKPEYKEFSPIVELILDFAEKTGQAELIKKEARQRQAHNILESGDENLDVGNSDIEDESFFNTDEVKSAGEMHVDDNDSLSQSRITDHISSKISLVDLANKAIAQYLLDNGILKEDKIIEKLRSEGLGRQRSNEILGIIKYIKLTDGLNRKIVKTSADGNFGGDTNFDFEV